MGKLNMEPDSVTSEVRKVVGLVLGRTVDNDDVRRENEPKWDSLKHMEIIFAIEDALDVKFQEEELPGLNSIHAIVQAVRQQHAA